VQLLVPAEAAGILFTANPLNGVREQAMITATWGLGEAIVGGMVTPDTLTVEKASGRVIERETADKQVMTVRTESGTEEQATPETLRRAPVLSDEQATELAKVGVQIAGLYGMPMDIEWVLAGGEFAIVQARPITALPEPELPPPTEWPVRNPKAMYIRGSIAEHLPNPVSPLFGTLGLRATNVATAELTQGFMGLDAQDPLVVYTTINGYAYQEGVYGAKKMLSLTWKFIAGIGTIMKTSTVRWRAARKALADLVAEWEARPATSLSPSELLAGAREVMLESARYYTVIQSGVLIAAGISEALFTNLYKLVKRKGDPDATALLFGFDSAPLLSEKSLFDLAAWAKTHPALRDYLLGTPSGTLALHLRSEQPPKGVPAEDWTEWKGRFEKHLADFGRTSYEYDFMNPTPADTPETLLEAARMYLEGKGSNPYERQREAIERSEQTTRRLERRTTLLPKRWFNRALRWARDSGPLLEDSIADLGMGHPVIRRLLGELGSRFVVGGAIGSPADIYWLVEDEVAGLAAGLERGEPLPDYAGRVSPRKVEWRAQRRAVPPAMLPRGSRWSKLVAWDRQDPSGSTLKGLGASTGRVTAPACVLLGPEDFSKMKPGCVLVAVTTTPAWTPLFTMAVAVVTDIGGPLSHTSIVAREYGIPAVMATGMATRRIHSGE